MEVKDLPEAARIALKEAGADVAAVICVDQNGTTQLMKNRDAGSKDTKYPIETTAIEGITSVSIVQHKGSQCWTVIIGGVPVTICIPPS